MINWERRGDALKAIHDAVQNVLLTDGSRTLTNNLVGSKSDPLYDMLAKLKLGLSFPSDDPLYADLTMPYIDLRSEYPIGTFADEWRIVNAGPFGLGLSFEQFDSSSWLQRFIVDATNFSILLNLVLSGNLLPDVDATRNIGSSSYKFKNLFLSEYVQAVGWVGSFNPSSGNAFDLGSSSLVWKDLWLGSYLRTGKVSSLPSPSVSHRGKIVRVEGASGVADTLYCCMKKADDSYEWVQVATG